MTGISTLGQALSQIDRIQDQQILLNDLSTQLATGRKTQRFSGLDTEVLSLQRARADFSSLEAYTDNIKSADRRMSLTLNAIEEFKAQAENFANALTGFSQQSAHQDGDVVFFDDPLTPEIENVPIGHDSADPDIDLETLQDLATNIFGFLVELVNVKDGDRYLLSGADALTPPLGDTSLLDTAVATQISDFKNGTLATTDLIANLQDRTIDNGNIDALTDTVIGYSASLSAGNAGNVVVRVDDGVEIDYTAFGNDQGFRDILVAVSYFKSEGLPPIVDHVEIDATTGLPNVLTQGSPGANIDEQTDSFYDVLNALATQVNQAIDDIDQQRFKLENVRAQINDIRLGHQDQQSVLQNTISGIEEVDINEVAVQLNSLQLQLEASFRVSARVQELSLVNFI